MIRVQTADFSVEAELQGLRRQAPGKVGALCSFTGLVRDFGDRDDLLGMRLEHYPGMTEKSLQGIVSQAQQRWDLLGVTVIHRVGDLDIDEQIVFVGVSSAHRGDAFAACEFIMDYLKVSAPFWKKERTRDGDHWVEAKDSDQQRAEDWDQAD